METKLGDDIVSGVDTEALLDADPPGFWVTWIRWDSGFRPSLRLRDLILAVNGQPLTPFLRAGKQAKGVGQYAENQYWAEIGARHDQEVTLSVLRDGTPVDVTGRLHANYFYYGPTDRPALAPGGPEGLATDGFDQAWSTWLEKLVWKMSYVLVMGWTQSSFNNRTELAEHMEHEARLDLLREKYPGPFADAMREDWTRVRDCLAGKVLRPGDIDLEYRAMGEKRVQIAKEQAALAWKAFLEEHKDRLIPAFPAPSPLEPGEAVGNVVELPEIRPRSILNDLGRTFAAIGSPSDGYYFILLETKDVYRFYETLYRYKGQVNPQLPERFRYVGRIRDEPQMFTVDRRPAVGLLVEPMGVLAGDDELFVDLRKEPAAFAGEALLSTFETPPLDDSSPAAVVEAMIRAVKTGDEATWRGLFAVWRVTAGPGGRTVIDPSYAVRPGMYAGDWDRSRQLIMTKVYDARVERVEPVKRVLTRDAESGLPNVDQVTVWVDHYGLFDGEYRTFKDVNVNRQWVLQRLDEGPWRITTLQHL